MCLPIGLIWLRIGMNCAFFFSEHLMNVPKTVRKFLSQQLFAIHEGLCCMLGNTQTWRVSHCNIWTAGCMTKKSSSNSGRGTNFLCRLCLRSSQLHVHVPHGVQWLWQEGNQSCLSSAKMSVWTRTPAPPYGFIVWYLIKHMEGSVQ